MDSLCPLEKETIGEIADMAGQFAIIKNGNVDSLYKNL